MSPPPRLERRHKNRLAALQGAVRPAPEDDMDCPKCKGYMVEEVAHDWIDGLATMQTRCLNCGYIQWPAECCDMTREYATEVTR